MYIYLLHLSIISWHDMARFCNEIAMVKLPWVIDDVYMANCRRIVVPTYRLCMTNRQTDVSGRKGAKPTRNSFIIVYGNSATFGDSCDVDALLSLFCRSMSRYQALLHRFCQSSAASPWEGYRGKTCSLALVLCNLWIAIGCCHRHWQHWHTETIGWTPAIDSKSPPSCKYWDNNGKYSWGVKRHFVILCNQWIILRACLVQPMSDEEPFQTLEFLVRDWPHYEERLGRFYVERLECSSKCCRKIWTCPVPEQWWRSTWTSDLQSCT